MQCRTDKLGTTLEKRGLAPIYLLWGDEPLQMTEAGDAVRRAARAAGIDERLALDVEPGFDWRRLAQASESLSLFATRRLIELRISGAKVGVEGARAIKDYAARPPPDDVLLITTGKLDRQAQQADWVRAIDAAGVVVPVYPIDRERLPAWVESRMASRQLSASPDAAQLIAERVEGNLLAAAQEVDVLALLFGPGALRADQILAAVSDSSRFNAFELSEAAMNGEAARAVRILQGLRQEGVEPVVVGWVLVRDLRSLCVLSLAAARNRPLAPLFPKLRIWDKQRGAYQRALRAHRTSDLRELLRGGFYVDRLCKSSGDDPWAAIVWLCLRLAGVHAVPRLGSGTV